MDTMNETFERRVPVTAFMRKSLQRELMLLAFNANMTMRGFMMLALKEKGLDVRDEDMVDRRTAR